MEQLNYAMPLVKILFTHCTRENKWTLWEDYPIYTLHSRKQVDPMGGLSLHTALTHCTRENKWTLWEDYPIYTLHSRKQVDPMGGLSYLHTALEKTSGPYGRIILFTHCTRENKWTLWEDYPIYTLHSRKQVDPMGGLSYLHTALEKTSGPNGRIILFTHCTRENKWILWEDYPIYTLHSRKQVDPMGGLSYLHTALEKTSGPYGRIILFTHCTRGNKWTLWEDYPIYTLHSRKQVDPMGGLSYLHTALEKTSGPYGRIILFTHWTRENKWTLWEDYPTYTLHSRKQVDPMGGLSYLHTALEKTSGPNGRIILFTHCTRGNKWILWEDYPIYTLHSRKQVDPMGGLSYLHTALEKTSGPYGRIILFTHCTRENKWILWEDYPIYTLHSRKQVDPMGGLSYFTHCTRENKWTQWEDYPNTLHSRKQVDLWEDYPIYTLDSRKQVDPMGGLSYLHTGLEKTSGPNGRIILLTHCTRENKWTLWEDYPIYTLHSRKQVDPMGGLSYLENKWTLHSRKQVDPMGGLSYLHTALEKTSGSYGRIILLTHCTRENKWTQWEDYPIYTLHSRKQVDPMGGLSYLHTALEKTSGPYGRIILFTHCTRENKWTLWEDYPTYTLHSRKQVDPMGGLSYLHTGLEKTSGPYGRIILLTHCTRENKWILWEDYPIYTLHSRKQVDPMGGLSYLHTALEKTSGPYGRIILFTHCTRENKWTPMGGLSYLHTALEKTSGPYGRIILFTHCTRENKWTLWEDYPIYTLHSRKQVDPMGGLSYLHTALEKTSGPYGRIILFTHCTRENKWTLWEDYPTYTLHSRKQVDPMGGLSYLHTALEETSGSYGRIILFTHCTRENKWILWEDYPIYTLHSRKQVDPMGGLSYLHTALEKTSGPYGRIILFTHCTRENKWILWEDYPIYTLHSRKQVDPMGGLSYLHTALEKTSGSYGRIILFTHCTRENKWTLWEDYPIYTLHSRKQVDPMGGLSYLHTALEKTSGSYGRIILFTHCTRENKRILWENYPSHLNNTEHLTLYHLIFEL